MAHADDLPPSSAPPEENRRWWDELDPARRDTFLAQPPTELGARDGLPAEVRDAANRAALDRHIERTDDPDAVLLRDSIGSTTAPPHQRSYLLRFEPPSTTGATDALVAVSMGQPDTADRTCVYVPGATNTMGNIDYGIDFARQLKSEVDAHSDGHATSACVVWLGYNAPDSAVPGALRRQPAREGGERLNEFLAGLAASTTIPPSDRSTTVYGHSYGSVVVGNAATGDRAFHASRVVVAGSPGMGRHVRSARDLNVPEGQVFAAAADLDVVTHAPRVIHGTDPASREFGARVFSAEQGGHEAYFPQGSGGMRNLRNIVTGRLDRVRYVEPRVTSGLTAIMRTPELRQSVKDRAAQAGGKDGAPQFRSRRGPPSVDRRGPRR
ncbi:hypothetical protein J4H86_04425 [Spiractinospora alimapuensis]|uniref:alpha/beta hydrolase n=1 Tax=Spiractinospora alimapuensis TaxID=2820884 RepID=UPI001F379020|nr:alpha/beta hydrolase [Spiractinospora alimapuensis]QVQ53056.1 hypothetical protein J4H86_04425 [Spiractinospora alimapuensis]